MPLIAANRRRRQRQRHKRAVCLIKTIRRHLWICVIDFNVRDFWNQSTWRRPTAVWFGLLHNSGILFCSVASIGSVMVASGLICNNFCTYYRMYVHQTYSYAVKECNLGLYSPFLLLRCDRIRTCTQIVNNSYLARNVTGKEPSRSLPNRGNFSDYPFVRGCNAMRKHSFPLSELIFVLKKKQSAS